MKIVLLHYSAPPVVGGVESVIGHHARLMSEAGHDVQIAAGRGKQTDERVGFVQIPMADSRHPVVNSVKAELDNGIVPNEFHDLVERLTDELGNVVNGADCLIAHNVCSLNKNLILTAALKKISEESQGPRFILWHHDLAWKMDRYRDELYKGYPWDLLRTAWDGVEQVTISEHRRGELAELMKLPEEDIRVIPNGVDVTRFLQLGGTTSRFIKTLDLLNASPILLLPVRITPRKNIELAIQVMNELCEKFPQAKLIVTGPLGSHNPANLKYFEELKSLRNSIRLESSVHFLAELEGETLPDEVIGDFYQLADALFLPSHEEGFGIPILEGGLAGIPVFCSRIPPLEALGRDSKTDTEFVQFFELEANPTEIASQIHEHLSNSTLFRFRTVVRSHYAWRQIYEKHIEPLLERVSEG